MKYPITITPDTTASGEVAESLITCRDLPIMTSAGTGVDECMKNAKEAIESTIDIMLAEKQYIPPPSSPLLGGVLVEIDPSYERLVTFGNARATHTAGTKVMDDQTRAMIEKHNTEDNAGKVVIVVSEKDAKTGEQ